MAEFFYGPWRVSAPYASTHYTERFVIVGSDNADGEYLPPFPDGVTVEVTGEAWWIDLQLLHLDGSGNWFSQPVSRANSFIAPHGLVSVLHRADRPRLIVECVCRDPAMKPPNVPNPYDFTLPERQYRDPCYKARSVRST